MISGGAILLEVPLNVRRHVAAQSSRETDKDSSSDSDGSAGSRSETSSIMTQIIFSDFCIYMCPICQSTYLAGCA